MLTPGIPYPLEGWAKEEGGQGWGKGTSYHSSKIGEQGMMRATEGLDGEIIEEGATELLAVGWRVSRADEALTKASSS